jgi:hypothetical protein
MEALNVLRLSRKSLLVPGSTCNNGAKQSGLLHKLNTIQESSPEPVPGARFISASPSMSCTQGESHHQAERATHGIFSLVSFFHAKHSNKLRRRYEDAEFFHLAPNGSKASRFPPVGSRQQWFAKTVCGRVSGSCSVIPI